MHSLQIPLRVEARGDVALRSSFTHFSHREVPKQIQFCHTQSQRANWFARRGCGVRRMSVFDPVIRASRDLFNHFFRVSDPYNNDGWQFERSPRYRLSYFKSS